MTAYATATANATNTVTATPADPAATVTLRCGETALDNGAAATWAEGENTITAMVTNGSATKNYTVTVTKS